MPSKRQYDLVQNDDYDTRIPLHPEEAFHHGITFQAKYIGMLDVPRPTSRVEIVAAMRRIRYEFKAKGIKKKKVTIEVSVDGVKVTLRKKKKRKHWLDDGKSVILNHPIYRIFYVSHDSQDLKIFSYIARDGSSNIFKCAVFKSNKKSQAMRVVRTVGQAFEVCHKLSINAPENDHLDNDEQDTLTQDLLSDRLSDITSDKPKKDIISEGASDKMSLPPDDNSIKDSYSEYNKNMRPPPQIDILAPPPDSNPQKSSLISAETYASPHSDGLSNVGVGTGSSSLPPAGSALSAHHEIQLLREQLDQQSQQTQAAMAQLQLVREQLAAEQSARLEAQARTHQLLVHNRELLDHIAALVAHLQGGDKPGQQHTPPHMAMPQHQHQHHLGSGDLSEAVPLDSSMLQTLGLNPQGLIENRAVTSCLPSSPLRNAFNPGGSVFNFPYPPPVDTSSFESQLLQRLSASYNQPSPYPYPYSQTLPFLSPSLYNQPLLNNNYTLQPPPQKKPQQPSPLAMPHSYGGSGLPETRLSPARNSEPKQIPSPQFQNQQKVAQFQQQQQQSPHYQQSLSNSHSQSSQHLQVQQNVRQQRETSPNPHNSPQTERRESQFIKPLAQIGTLTTTDSDGRVRVIVPVPSNSNEDAGSLLANLRITDDFRPLNGPPITRSTSEKVPNRSELMSQVHRTAWARHTTK